jgi:hypothetical protein
MRQPAEFALQAETSPRLPPGRCERVSGYGVMGLPFASGHLLGLRRWTASSVGEPFTSVWHRDPDGRWTFYESSEVACTRYFGDEVDDVRIEPIEVRWDGPQRLCAHSHSVDWTIELTATLVTRMISAAGSLLPLTLWRSKPVLTVMGRFAGSALNVGKVNLTGLTSNDQPFDANPRRIWRVSASQATVNGEDLGPIGPLAEQAHMGDFYFPQHGIFAIGRVFVDTRPTNHSTAHPRGPA